MTPEDFPKLFAACFAAQDGAGLSGFLAEDADVVTLTGASAEGAEEARNLFDSEFAGIFARAKLVSGRTRLRPLGPGGAILHQRYVVICAQDAEGQELPRFAAALTVVLLARNDGWRAVSLVFSPLA